ncbi:MAG: histidine phosphatase family protein [Bacteroidota bacterium]|nr:histidine phosphatase family protein [Bacteroidota bacterium]
MTKLLLIRHATTAMVGKKIAGRIKGVRLSEEGYAQATHLAERLQKVTIAAVYSSPLERAIETATPIAEQLQLPVTELPELIELDFGEWTGAEIDALKSDRQFQLFNTFRSSTKVPGGEWMSAAQTRMVNCLQQLCSKHPAQTVAVVGHSDLIKAAIAHYAGIHLDLFHRIEISPASLSIVDVFPETARISLLNHTGELAQAVKV